jgi:transposase
MIAAQFVAPYRIQGKSGKNDANDAAAICEAASRPHMNFVPPKTLAQQGMLCVHRLREGLKQERTACINRIRGLLAEFGIVLPQSPQVLRQHLSELIEDASNDIAGMARLVLQTADHAVCAVQHLDGQAGAYAKSAGMSASAKIQRAANRVKNTAMQP